MDNAPRLRLKEEWLKEEWLKEEWLKEEWLKEEWLKEESIAHIHIHGWDFSHIDGRYEEE